MLAAAAAGGGGIVAPRPAAAQPAAQIPGTCSTAAGQPVRVAAGRRITAIVVSTAPPDRLPGGVRLPLHMTTRPETVRSRLLLTVGQSLDTARVAESVRQLQALSYLQDVRITAACDQADGVALTVATRDAWSIRPNLSVRSGQRASVGIAETNLFGTGRTARLYVRSDQGQLGVGAAYADPTLFNRHALVAVRRDAYADGHGWGATLRTWNATVFAPWGAGIAVQQSSRMSVRQSAFTAPGDTVRRATALALVSHRLSLTPSGATFLRFGVEGERTAVSAGPGLLLVGPPRVRRTFAGVDVGVARRSARYVTAPWLLPESSESLRLGLTRPDVPRGLEGEGLVSVGHDFTTRALATHFDLWTGRIFPLGRRSASAAPRALLSADLWTSGYHPMGGSGAWNGGTLRGSVGFAAPASHGLWLARVSAEHLADPDPDTRSLALIDPVQRALPAAGRLAESAIAGSVERSRHLFRLTRNYVLDAAVFGAGSVRWEGAEPWFAGVPGQSAAGLLGGERLYVGSVGAGFRLTPTRFGPGTIRLDAGIPVVRSRMLSGRPFFAVSITPAFGIGRQRDSRGVLGGL
ncbi:MAG: hypothetical protein M3154_01955 [Candidatus Eremiobacteraeota bacterium]|nr:hypothetical protein [Candidatus Eremiobacteraeota bacterium]